MGSEQEFLEGLQELVRIGKTNNNVLTQEEVQSYFSDMFLDEAQMGLIAAYMAENQIYIKGVIPNPNLNLPEEEQVDSKEEPSVALDMYIEEMEEVHSMHQEGEKKYLHLLEMGDKDAVNHLVELNLKKVVEIARSYGGKGMQMNDLIQEGNLALFCAIMEYQKEKHGEFSDYIIQKIHNAMEHAVKENIIATSGGRKMAGMINQMNELATAIARETGKEAKPEELAEKMNITVEEVKDLMKISLDAVSVFEKK